MKFYEIGNGLQEAVDAGNEPVRIKIEIEKKGVFESVDEDDIIEARFFGLKEAAGGVSARGEILMREAAKEKSEERGDAAGKEVRVYFTVGEGRAWVKRFVFYIDDKGFQDLRGPGRKRFAKIGLRDLSYKLRKIDEARDWIAPPVFAYTAVCDKGDTQKSLLHLIAGRAGIRSEEIACEDIPVTLPYARLRRNVWAELSSLAYSYRCHLECGAEKAAVFVNSPYKKKEEKKEKEKSVYTLKGEDIFYLRETERADLYRNSVRLKVNMPVSLERREIWRYDEAPVFYDENLQAYYPFKRPLIRGIEKGKYEAGYRVIDENGSERNVIYADEIDTKEEAEKRLEYVASEELEEKNEKSIKYALYDVASNYDRAIVTLEKELDGDLYKAAIHGRPIVLDLNRSCFVRDSDGVAACGTAALNVTGSYFSDYEVGGVPHYEDWAKRELAERIQKRREFSVKTHKGIFHARAGAKVKIKMKEERNRGENCGVINVFSFLYRKDKAFVAALKIIGEK